MLFYYRAWAYLEGGLESPALDDFERFANARAANLTGMSYLALNNPNEAKNYFKQATLIDPQFGQAHYNLGRTNRWLENYELAATAFQRSLQHVSDSALLTDIYFQLGECNFKLEEYGKAVVAFDMVLRLKPWDEFALEYLGNIFFLEEEYWEAASYFEKLAVVRDDAQTFYKLGLCFMKNRDYSLAQSQFETAISIDSEHLPSYVNLAKCYANQYEYDWAIKTLEEALILSSDDADLLVLIGFCHREKGNRKESKAFFEQAKSINPEVEIPE